MSFIFRDWSKGCFLLILLLIVVVLGFRCKSNNQHERQVKINTEEILEFYSYQSEFTDPGKY